MEVRIGAGARALAHGWLSALAAVALAAAAHATVGETTYDPSFRGKYDDYPFGELFTNVRAKNTTIAKGCPYTKRGVLLKGTGPEVDGTFRIFDGDIGPRGFMADTCVDVSRLDTPGAFAGFELGTPVVPVGTAPAAFVFAGVVRQANDSLTAFVATQNGTLPMTLPLPAATPAVKLHFAWDGGAVDVLAGPCDAVTVQPLATDVPLVFDESATFGAGITRADQGDAAGFAFFASGDLYDEAKRDVLLDLQAVIDLENAALADLGAGNPADARTKLEDARKLLEEQGPQVPGSDPPEFEPDLLEKVGALTGLDPAVKADVEKRLTKAAERDAKASAKIDSGNPKDLKEAEKQATKARDEKVRAKAVLETEVVKEGKGAL